MNVLIVENDRHLHTILKEVAITLKLHPDIAMTVEKSIELLDEKRYSLLVIDRILDDGDGLDVLEYARDVQPESKVLFLSQKNQVLDRVNGLEKGADDYMGKPFSLAELKLRLKKLLSMQKPHRLDTSVSTESVSIDLHTGDVTCADSKYHLRKREAEILSYLMKHKDQVVSREDLVWAVWQSTGQPSPSLTTLDVYIRRIRMHLPNSPHLIQTVRGYGYRFTDS